MGGYYPPQWASGAQTQVLLIFPGQQQGVQYAAATGVGATLPTAKTRYVFDAVIRLEHQQQLTVTEHPVQTGASISDHAYLQPARVVLDIGMSDVMASRQSPSPWQGSFSKSVSAYQTMLALQFSRIPLTLTTRLRTYQNVVILSITPEETVKTIAGLRMTVEFQQIFFGNTYSVPASARPQDTVNTPVGQVAPQPLTTTQMQQYGAPGGSFSSVPGHF